MRRTGEARLLRHPCHSHAAAYAADITDIRLNDVGRLHTDHAAELRKVDLLLSLRHGDRKRVGDLRRPFEFGIRTRFLEMPYGIILEHPANLDGPRWRKSAVGVAKNLYVVAQRLADGGNNGLCAAWPAIHVVAEIVADTDLEGAEALLVAQARQAGRLIIGCDGAPHSGAVDRLLRFGAAKQCRHALALTLAFKVPKGGIDSGNGTCGIGTGEFMRADHAGIDKSVDTGRIGAEDHGRHLAMQNGRGDVGIVRRDLTIALEP